MERNNSFMEETVIDRITALARSYTPEWRFDPDEPDIGSALAIVYAGMLEQTHKRLSRVPEKNRVAFLNSLGADLLPAVPAEGYVQFRLVNEEVDGVPVEEGTVVYADSDDAPDQVVAYETGESMYATPAELSELFVTQDETDTIVRLYDRAEEEWKPVQLFTVTGENRQCHELYIAHDTVLGIRREAYVELEILHSMSPHGMMRLYQSLADPTVAVWEYETEKGWEAFENAEPTSGTLRLHKKKDQPAFAKKEREGRESYWIRVRLNNIGEIEKLRMTGVKLASSGREILPDVLYGADEERELRRCLPFGERLDLYQTVYFGSEEVLSKKGALCTLSFRVDFARVPLDTNESQSFNWEWVMRRSDFKPNYEFDVTVEKVVWEYFNGTGWTRLFSTDEHDRTFSVPDGVSGQYETLTFLIPGDIESTLVGATETFYVRARILKINNLYKLQGQYVLPVIESTSLKYEYGVGQYGQDYLLKNNLETLRPVQEGNEITPFAPFFRTGTQAMTGYFSFETSPVGVPVKILFDVVPTHGESQRHLVWEYSCGDKWKPLNLIDETGQLTRTGIVTYTIPPDIRRVRLFGRERFWLRLVAEDGFDNEDAEPLILNRIRMNVTPVREVGNRRLEFFSMELYQPGIRLDLPDKNITEAEVWVDERGGLNRAEEELLRESEDLEEEFGDEGELLHSWVRWQRVGDFYTSEPEDRQFILHRYTGQIEFGDGKRGRIPPPSNEENVRVRYVTGGGAYTNLPVGSIDRMDRAIGFINRVENVSPLAGGCDPESPEQGIRRETEALCHQNRAVTMQDYESLAMRASREISRVRCFSGYDGEGRNRAGAITLVVVLEDYDGEMLHFTELKDQVSQYLKVHVHPALTAPGRLYVVPPEYVECRLYVELTVADLGRVFRVKKELEERVAKFLDPIRGKGGVGWEIGEFPNTIRIQNEISDIRGISYISKVVLNTYGLSGVNKGREIDVRRIPRSRYILPVPGEIEVVINSQ